VCGCDRRLDTEYLMSTRESKDPAMDWFMGELRLDSEVSEVISYRSASVL
jgi:hypothetical protein